MFSQLANFLWLKQKYYQKCYRSWLFHYKLCQSVPIFSKFSIEIQFAKALNHLLAKIHFPAALLPFQCQIIAHSPCFVPWIIITKPCTSSALIVHANARLHAARSAHLLLVAWAQVGTWCAQRGFQDWYKKVPPDWRTCKWGQFRVGGGDASLRT